MNKFKTAAIHGGQTEPNPFHSLNPPICQTSTFTFDNLDHAEEVMSFRSTDYVYTRGNNPTLRLLENRVAELEGGAGAVAFSSGMGAISTVLMSLLKPGDRVIAHKTLYGSAFSFITEMLVKYGMSYELIDLTCAENLEKVMDSKTKVVYFETPSNPDLSIIDIVKVSEIAHARGAKVVVDNTFASPYFQRPLELGADVVVHSATKYLCGHGDVVAGIAVASSEEYIANLKFGYMCEFGNVMSPFNAWLILRGIKTMGIRMREHEKNAIEVAKFLSEQDKIGEVKYPGLETHPGHEIAKKQMDGFGGMITFEVKGGLDAAKRFVDGLKLFQLAVSLGDCESLVELPAVLTHRGYPKEKLKEFGLTESMVRISVGLEDVEDIIQDLRQALENI